MVTPAAASCRHTSKFRSLFSEPAVFRCSRAPDLELKAKRRRPGLDELDLGCRIAQHIAVPGGGGEQHPAHQLRVRRVRHVNGSA